MFVMGRNVHLQVPLGERHPTSETSARVVINDFTEVAHPALPRAKSIQPRCAWFDDTSEILKSGI
jgi:hypothetical protein